MADLFKELLPSILYTKKYCLESEEDIRAYSPFMVNRAVGHHIDCIMYANQMNLNPQLPKKLQYDYLINKVKAVKRPYTKWFKAYEERDLEAVKMFFGYSDKRAREALNVLTPEQVKEIKTKTTIGE